MPIEKTIYFYADGFKLVGTLHMPGTPNPPVVIGCHGLLANRYSPKQISLAAECNRIGLAYFRFDHRGCGGSQGELSKVTTLAGRCRDLYHAIQSMQHRSNLGPLAALFGSSFGGTVVLAHAAKHPSPALITYAAPINSTAIHQANIRDNKGQSPNKALFTDALTFDIIPSLKAVKNVLVSHCRNDEVVPVHHAEQIYKAAISPKKSLLLNNGDHIMSNIEHQHRFKKAFLEWITKDQHLKQHPIP